MTTKELIRQYVLPACRSMWRLEKGKLEEIEEIMKEYQKAYDKGWIEGRHNLVEAMKKEVAK